MPMATNEWYFSGIAWYYGDNDFTFDFIARSDVKHMACNKKVFISGIAWYYGGNDFIVRTFNFIANSDAARVTCSTWYEFSHDL